MGKEKRFYARETIRGIRISTSLVEISPLFND